MNRIKYKGRIYVKADQTRPAPKGRGGFGKQKALTPPVVRELPGNPDPLFEKAVKALEKIDDLLEKMEIDPRDLDFKLLIKRYNLPTLTVLLSQWGGFKNEFRSRIKRATNEIRAARGMNDEG